MKRRLFKAKIYFTRGHQNLIYGPWMLNIILLLFIAIGDVGIWIGLGFLSCYVLFCVFVGRWDYLKGTWKAEVETQFRNNPEWMRMMDKLDGVEEQIARLRLVYVEEIMKR